MEDRQGNMERGGALFETTSGRHVVEWRRRGAAGIVIIHQSDCRPFSLPSMEHVRAASGLLFFLFRQKMA